MRLVISLLLLLTSLTSFADDKVLNLYNWSNYMPDSVIQEFEKETGIHVNYTIYDNNETLYTKLRADPHAGYDVIVPSSYFIQRMAQAGVLHKFDKSKIPNFKYINPRLLHQSFDPNNDYTIPYLWGVTGLAYNSKYIHFNNNTRYADLWQPQYKNQLLLLDDMREAFSIAFIALGYSINDTNPDHIKQAYEKLVQLLPNIKLFNTDTVQTILVDEDAWIGAIWNGDLYQASADNPALKYVYPKDGFAYWIDTLAIPKYAPHLNNAYKFINFVSRPDIAEQIATYQGYSTPNFAAVKIMPKDLRENTIFNPPPSVMKRGQLMADVGEAENIYEKYWELLKIGGN